MFVSSALAMYVLDNELGLTSACQCRLRVFVLRICTVSRFTGDSISIPVIIHRNYSRFVHSTDSQALHSSSVDLVRFPNAVGECFIRLCLKLASADYAATSLTSSLERTMWRITITGTKLCNARSATILKTLRMIIINTTFAMLRR